MYKEEIGMGCGAMLALCALIMAVFVGLSALSGWIFMTIWNFAIVETFAAPVLDFWHAWALWIVIGMIGSAFKAVTRTKNKE